MSPQYETSDKTFKIQSIIPVEHYEALRDISIVTGLNISSLVSHIIDAFLDKVPTELDISGSVEIVKQRHLEVLGTLGIKAPDKK